jgi:GNAT superfamily N-acetyltransferase
MPLTGVFRPHSLEHNVPPRWLRDAGEVSALYVSPGRQRRGVGRGLLRAAAAHHARAGRQRLIVGALTAADAMGFYAAMGGRPVGRCAYPDEDGMALDGVVFGWLLPSWLHRSAAGPGPAPS